MCLANGFSQYSVSKFINEERVSGIHPFDQIILYCMNIPYFVILSQGTVRISPSFGLLLIML